MKLRFIYVPVKDIAAAKSFYIGTLGGELLWEEGGLTCGVMLPGDHVQVMLDQDPSEGVGGPFYAVPNVHDFIASMNGSLTFVRGPDRIPPGWYAVFKDSEGNLIRVMDDTESRERQAKEIAQG